MSLKQTQQHWDGLQGEPGLQEGWQRCRHHPQEQREASATPHTTAVWHTRLHEHFAFLLDNFLDCSLIFLPCGLRVSHLHNTVEWGIRIHFPRWNEFGDGGLFQESLCTDALGFQEH